MLACASLAPAQTLNLDQTAAPAPGDGMNSAALVDSLQKEIADLSRPGVPGAGVRSLVRTIAIDLIKAGVAQGPSGSAHVVLGRTLAQRREAIDRWGADHDLPPDVLSLMKEAAGAGVPPERDAMEVWARDALGPLVVFAWPNETIGWPVELSRVSVRVPTESLPDLAMHAQFSDAVSAVFARVEERLAAAEQFGVTRPGAWRLRDDIAAAASIAGPQKPRWMSDPTLAAWRSELVACVTSLIRSTGAAAYTPMQAAARLRVMRLAAELSTRLQTLEPAASGRASLTALDQLVSVSEFRTDAGVADRLLAAMDALSLIHAAPADDKSLLRQLRPAARALEPAARNAASQLLEDLPRIIKRSDALADPGLLASINSARRRRDDQSLVRRLSELCADEARTVTPPTKDAAPNKDSPTDAAPGVTPPAPADSKPEIKPEIKPDTKPADSTPPAPKPTEFKVPEATLDPRLKNIGARLLVLGQDLSRNDKRDLAIGELRGLVTELANFRSLPGEDEANFAGGVTTGAHAPATQVSVSRVRTWASLTHAKLTDVLAALSRVRSDWLAGWASAKGSPAPENAAPLEAYRAVFAVLSDAAAALDAESSMNAWPGFELSPDARAQLTDPLASACAAMVESLLSANYEDATRAAARIRAEHAAALLVGRLERLAGAESLGESRDATFGALSQLVAGRPDAENAWLLAGYTDIRADIASVCRYAAELVPPCDHPERFRAYITKRADLVLSTLESRGAR
ncbi:MAG: hypothetical protein U0638_08805 [Phycisphaerales bacterium]